MPLAVGTSTASWEVMGASGSILSESSIRIFQIGVGAPFRRRGQAGFDCAPTPRSSFANDHSLDLIGRACNYFSLKASNSLGSRPQRHRHETTRDDNLPGRWTERGGIHHFCGRGPSPVWLENDEFDVG